MGYQTAPQRACQETESFRKSGKSFWLFEVGGVAVFGIIGALIGGWLTPPNSNMFWQNGWPSIGGGIGVILGFIIVFISIYLWNLFRAPYKQRNEARTSLENIKQWESFLKNIKKGDTITGKVINVPLLFQLQGINTLASVTFVRCTFRGPCSMRIEDKSEVRGADFKGKLDESFIELTREGTYLGLVRFVFCKFEYCKFENVSIVGFQDTYEKLKENSVQL